MSIHCASLLGGLLLSLTCTGVLGAESASIPNSNGQEQQQQQTLPPRGAKHFMTDPPGAAFYPQYVPGPYPPHMPITGTPAYQWGYFGARSKTNAYPHWGFHSDKTDWYTPRRR
jgi:hypothetical protein